MLTHHYFWSCWELSFPGAMIHSANEYPKFHLACWARASGRQEGNKCSSPLPCSVRWETLARCWCGENTRPGLLAHLCHWLCAVISSVLHSLSCNWCVCACVCGRVHAHMHALSHTSHCLTLCDPLDCSLPGFSVHWILPARILEWVTFSTPRDLPNPELEPVSSVSPALLAESLPTEPYNIYLFMQENGLSWVSSLMKVYKYMLQVSTIQIKAWNIFPTPQTSLLPLPNQ